MMLLVRTNTDKGSLRFFITLCASFLLVTQ
jgi:hypothetical protein